MNILGVEIYLNCEKFDAPKNGNTQNKFRFMTEFQAKAVSYCAGRLAYSVSSRLLTCDSFIYPHFPNLAIQCENRFLMSLTVARPLRIFTAFRYPKLYFVKPTLEYILLNKSSTFALIYLSIRLFWFIFVLLHNKQRSFQNGLLL